MKKFLIYGLARSGIAAANLLLKKGQIFLYDESFRPSAETNALIANGAVLVRKNHIEEILTQTDMLVISPGISIYNPIVQRAYKLGVEVLGELELGFRNLNCKTVGVTGTNGKTTTATMIHSILQAAGLTSHLLGNIGVPLTAKLPEIKPDDWCVLETSSFQLETATTFRPDIAVVTNITPDHIDRHKSFENYLLTKARIFQNQTQNGYAVLNRDDPHTPRLLPSIKAKVKYFSTKEEVIGAYMSGDFLLYRNECGETSNIVSVGELSVQGRHNWENALCAIAAAKLAGVNDADVAAGLKNFKAIPHRMQLIGNIGGVSFVNDSKATNVFSVLPALDAFKKNVCLILGGRDKDNDFDLLFANLKENIIKAVLVGEAADKLQAAAEKSGYKSYVKADTLENAVRIAYVSAKPDGVVLLSPACASFDMFENFEARGRAFENAVEVLKNENKN